MAGIMVGVFSKVGLVDELVKLLQDMKAEGTRLDQRLYQSALNAFKDASTGKAQEAIFYSYKRYINGFAAILNEDEAANVSSM
ncbi:hypothetical protein JHK86_009666 [Glycine max]|nr:hypothetical protein JHK86_009666 [Glycine max]